MKKYNKIILLVDSFKSSISSKEISHIGKEIINKYSNIDVIASSVADGGEGTVDFFINEMGYEKRECQTVNAFGEKIVTYYGVKDDKAVYDVASVVGFLVNGHLDIYQASTYGIGIVLKEIIHNGYKNVYLGLGGSITNDGGSGILEALGATFYNDDLLVELHKDGHKCVNKVDFKPVLELLEGVKITAICDVTNPLLGNMGATYIFSPQKGAKEEDLKVLEKWMENYAALFNVESSTPGCGAAGGIGFLIHVLGGKLEKGIDVILNELNLVTMLDPYTLLITGEGKLDKTSFYGKVVGKLSDLSEKYHNDLLIICGLKDLENSNYPVYALHEEMVSNYKETVNEDIKRVFHKIMKDYIDKISHLSLKEVSFDNHDYRLIREEVFVVEQNVSLDIEFDEEDYSSHHYLFYVDDKPIGTIRLTKHSNSLRICRVAIKKQYRGLGLGKVMIKLAEDAAKELGYQETFLNGQVPSIPFYEKCGYKAIGEVFYEANIPHKKMIKKS